MRVCQFRHFGKWTTLRGSSKSCLSGRTTLYFTDASLPVKRDSPQPNCGVRISKEGARLL
jgi:hypothetical protein